jgi:hypothetical protein
VVKKLTVRKRVSVTFLRHLMQSPSFSQAEAFQVLIELYHDARASCPSVRLSAAGDYRIAHRVVYVRLEMMVNR